MTLETFRHWLELTRATFPSAQITVSIRYTENGLIEVLTVSVV